MFALIQVQMGVIRMSIDEGDLGRGFRNGEVSIYTTSPLYSACGRRGQDAVVLLLLRIGLPVDELVREDFNEGDEKAPHRTALYRALSYNRLFAVKMLLRFVAWMSYEVWHGGRSEGADIPCVCHGANIQAR